MHSMSCYVKKLSSHPLIAGTLLLTGTGLLTRFIGFFYRIYLSRLFGEEGMGIYQLISPVISLSFCLFAAGYQTAISKLAAERAALVTDPRHPHTRHPLWAALSLSLPLSLLATACTYLLSAPIGITLLKEPRTVPLLQIIAFSFPFVSVHACINGWFYGMKKAGIPSLSQLLEQLTRVGCVYLVTSRELAAGRTPSVAVAVQGLALGELVSMLVTIVAIFPYCRPENSPCIPAYRPDSNPYSPKFKPDSNPVLPPATTLQTYRNLLTLALPLTANRLVLNFLGSIESVAIPQRLQLFGYSAEKALSVYGVLTGMAMPFIFFPNALTGSIAVMLLPMISENYYLKKWDTVKALTLRTLKYCLMMGAACMAVFILLGPWIGTYIFKSALAGRCIQTLGFICPFLYLDTTLSSILQGMGKAGTIFFINIASLLVRLAFVFWAIPVFGLPGYLWGMLAGQLLLTLLYTCCLISFFHHT